MSRLRYLSPFRIRAVAREIRRVRAGGGPARLRLARVGEPRGVVIPSAEIVLEIEARDGTVSRWAPALPIPWPYAWAWRLARLLRIPLVRSYDSERTSFEVPIPGRD